MSSLFQIKKLEGAKNYDIWRTQCYNVLMQKDQYKPIKAKGVKPSNITDEQWEKMDNLAMSTIMLTVVDSLVVGIRDEPTAWRMWQRLEDTYAKKSATGKAYWLKKLVGLHMKEGTPMSTHIIEFNSIFSQVINQGLKLDDELKATLILCSLPESWDTFRTSTSNSNPILLFADVESALLQEEMNRKNNAVGKSNALNTRSRSKTRGKDKERERSKSRSKKDLVCNYCGKKGHVEKKCF